MIDTILIPVDGSAGARKAIQFGSDLALQYAARVVLLHVLLHQNLAEALRGLSQVERSAGGGLEGLGEALGDVPLDQILAAGRDDAPTPREALEFIAAKIIEFSEKIVRAKGVTHIMTAVGGRRSGQTNSRTCGKGKRQRHRHGRARAEQHRGAPAWQRLAQSVPPSAMHMHHCSLRRCHVNRGLIQMRAD